jgi:stress-induced morphogen
MEISSEQLEAKIRNAINGVQSIRITDLSNCGCGAKFEIEVIAEEFQGLPLIAQHR